MHCNMFIRAVPLRIIINFVMMFFKLEELMNQRKTEPKLWYVEYKPICCYIKKKTIFKHVSQMLL